MNRSGVVGSGVGELSEGVKDASGGGKGRPVCDSQAASESG